MRASPNPVQPDDAVYRENLRLNQVEYYLEHIHLLSQPRCLGIVLGNACNLRCVHCYQAKNSDNLLRPAAIGRELRREFMAMYPYLDTLRIQGGEVFAIPEFQDLVDDVASVAARPLLSISTNGTLIDDVWAERMVRTPFRAVTVSIDAAHANTFARLRRGADLATVLANVARVQEWKRRLETAWPTLNSFFVILRSNFREIPDYLELMSELGIDEVALQTMEVNRENSSREPGLEQREAILDPAEVQEVHSVLKSAFARYRGAFQMIRVSGVRVLFDAQGLDSSFLEEEQCGLYPESGVFDRGRDGFALCPNPWTTLFVAENGNVHLCFLSEPIGNLYETPLSRLWNSPAAVAKRSDIIAGRYAASGCSQRWCSWREGNRRAPSDGKGIRQLLAEFGEMRRRAASLLPDAPSTARYPSALPALRRLFTSKDRRIAELECLFRQLCDTNTAIHENGRRYIDELEQRIEALQTHANHLEAKTEKAVADFHAIQDEFQRLRRPLSMRAAHQMVALWARMTRQPKR
ncbi:MAG: radical SAM protein [Bryobacterales bacterium]|nr:radical SAM protein [Bryobacterales bacterium]